MSHAFEQATRAIERITNEVERTEVMAALVDDAARGVGVNDIYTPRLADPGVRAYNRRHAIERTLPIAWHLKKQHAAMYDRIASLQPPGLTDDERRKRALVQRWGVVLQRQVLSEYIAARTKYLSEEKTA